MLPVSRVNNTTITNERKEAGIDRILDEVQTQGGGLGGKKIKLLVKWKDLSYAESSWEEMREIEGKVEEALQEFHRIESEGRYYPSGSLYYPPDSIHVLGQDWEQYASSPYYKNNNTLKNHQVEGLNWLLHNWQIGRNCVLNDEMSTGKKIQIAATFMHLKTKEAVSGPFLVVVPLTTVMAWQTVFKDWTTLNCVVYIGDQESREIIQKYEWNWRSSTTNENEEQQKQKNERRKYRFEVIITSFEILHRDINVFSSANPWKYVVMCDPQRVVRSTSGLNDLKALTYDRLTLLTGSPLHGDPILLGKLLSLIDPTNFSNESFVKEQSKYHSPQQSQELQNTLSKYILKRALVKTEESMRPVETVVDVKLSPLQKLEYRRTMEGSSRSTVYIMLRRICTHPYLIDGVEEKVVEELAKEGKKTPEAIAQKLINNSNKLVLLDNLLPYLSQSGQKVIIFSSMVRMLDILEDYLNIKNYTYERMDSSATVKQRNEALTRFSSRNDANNVGTFVLLCSVHMSLDRDFSVCDTVIIHDSDWNLQTRDNLFNALQCQKPGREKVRVITMVAEGTIESVLHDQCKTKLNPPSTTPEDIDKLLKFGTYTLSGCEEVKNEFDEKDIHQILDKVKTRDNVKFKTNTEEHQEENRRQTDLNDPNFWQKIHPFHSSSESPHTKPEPSKRKRKRVERPGFVDTREAVFEANEEGEERIEKDEI